MSYLQWEHHWWCSVKKGVLPNFPNFPGKHLWWSLFLIKLIFFKGDTPTQVFSCGICEIFKNTYFEDHLPTTAFIRYLMWTTYERSLLLVSLLRCFPLWFCEISKNTFFTVQLRWLFLGVSVSRHKNPFST